MTRTILTLTGFMVLGTTALLADGSTINLSNTAVASEIKDSTLNNSTVGIDIKTNQSNVNLSNTAVASSVTGDSTLYNSNVGIKIDDEGTTLPVKVVPQDRPAVSAGGGVSANAGDAAATTVATTPGANTEK